MKYDLEKILPHNRPMILIDDVLEINHDEKFLISEVFINKDKIFFDKQLNGISYLAGIEFMAQTIGCYSFFKANLQTPRVGFLLGTRSYKNNIEKFECGQTYKVVAKEVFGDGELVSFECFIYNSDGVECAKATVNAYLPENAENYLKNGF